jgi:L,D-transpeptidase YcbB
MIMAKKIGTDVALRPLLLFVPIALLLVVALADKGRAAESASATRQSSTAAGQELSAAGVAALRSIFDTAHLQDLRWPDFPPYRPEITKFYESDGFALAWIHGGKPTPQALALIQVLQDADNKGLNAEDYDAPRWADRVAKLNSSATEDELVHFDAALTVCVMRYVRAVHVGRVNPKEFKFELDVDNLKYNLGDFLRTKLVSASDPAAAVQRVEPTFPGYQRLLAGLPVYEQIAKGDDGEKLQSTSKPVLPGQPYASVPRLTRLLRRLGDLPESAQVPENSTVYEGPLVDAVKHYQLRHGDEPSGRLDAATINDLNIPLSARVRQMQLTLERWRWLAHSFSNPPVVVNLPEFRLRAMDEKGEPALIKTVIVGEAFGHKSPIFEKEIKYVVFRPYWEVAPSIERNEIIPHIARDRNYVATHRFEVVSANGTLVTDGRVSDEVLAQLKSGKLHVRQKPGPKNSLGLVKLIFPNTDNVYLHGTDEPELFSRTVRDFSHGCIRVQQPADLAAWALRNNPGWTLERVKATMNGTEENVQVNLVTTIPVLIVYGTAAVDEQHQFHFFDDIYGYDAELEAALAKGYPYPW